MHVDADDVPWMQGISEKGRKRSCGWQRNSGGIIRAAFISWTWRKISRGGPLNSKGTSCPRNNRSNSPEQVIQSSRSRPPQLAASCRCGVGIAIGNSNCCSNPNCCAILFSYLSVREPRFHSETGKAFWPDPRPSFMDLVSAPNCRLASDGASGSGGCGPLNLGGSSIWRTE